MTDIDNRTYYELLGVEPTASVDEIKEAYREIARIFHPDSNFYSDIIDDAGPEDSDVFKAITHAYQTLINEEKRRAYDDTLPKGLETWGDDEESRNFRASTDDSDETHRDVDAHPERNEPNGRERDVPEEWRKEREYFEEHFEEILKPAPKVNLTGTIEDADGHPTVSISGWEDSELPSPPENRFGDLSEEPLIPDVSGLPRPRREIAVDAGIDPLSIIMYVGMPVMFIIVVIEVILFF